MKHVGCYISEYSGLFKIEHKHVGERFQSRTRSDVFWTPYTYTLIPIKGGEVYYLDIILKDSDDAPDAGAKVEVLYQSAMSKFRPNYTIKEHK